MIQTISRRGFLSSTLAMSACATAQWGSNRRPNVILIITDDQGYGDLACHGHPALKTPNLDALHAESTRFTRFHVMPVCSPTRACLMTGRYNFRTGVVDTYLGRSMMYSEEITLAEVLRDHGYRTGIFGKWHLGDNYPLRAMDQGFEESLVHRGGGLAQPSDSGPGYFNPELSHNGVTIRREGYCTDIFTNAAMEFVSQHRNEPFFCYLAYNAPHTPLEVPEHYALPYRQAGHENQLADYFGMITNVDDNVGRLVAQLDALGLQDDTLVLFMTDNGAQVGATFYNAGMRGHKGTVYEGGIRVPFFMRWPGVLPEGSEVDCIAAHIDVFPTIAALCGCPVEKDRLDGVDLASAIRGEAPSERRLFFQWHRGDQPEAFRDCAVLSDCYKLVNGTELYDIELDPGEEKNIAAYHPTVVSEMREAYDRWFADVSATRGYDPPRIHIGTEFENPTILTRQDWRGADGWNDSDVGYWKVDVAADGAYRITVKHPGLERECSAVIRVAGVTAEKNVPPNTEQTIFELSLRSVPDTRLEFWIEGVTGKQGAQFVYVERR